MKLHLLTLSVLALLFYACGPVYVVHQDPPQQTAQAPAPDPEVSYQSFYDQLSPYGQWIDDPNYGYVWMPEAGPDFKPYATNGHWVYTDEGWTWASDYTWGWAVFHYGRWFFQNGYGWMWVPGHEWAPAWVSWRNSPEYYGWAPLGPNVSVNNSFGEYNPPPHYWCFVPHEYITSPQVRNYYVNESRNITIIHNTTIINNTTVINNNNNRNRGYSGGPDPREAGRYSGRELRPVSIRGNNTPGEQMNNGGLSIYRPRINPNTAPHTNPSSGGGNPRSTIAPPRLQTLNNARPVNTLRYNNEEANNGNTGYRNNEPGSGGGSQASPSGGERIEHAPPGGMTRQDQGSRGNNNQSPSNPQLQTPANPQPVTNAPSPEQPGRHLGLMLGQRHPAENQSGQNQSVQNQPVQNQPGQNATGQPGNSPGQSGGRFGQAGQGHPARNQPVQGNSSPSGQPNGSPAQTNSPGASTQPSQTTTPGRRMNPQHGTAPAMNTIHPMVKPAPQEHPVNNKDKDDDKKRDKKEN